jgi:hypothetical protein
MMPSQRRVAGPLKPRQSRGPMGRWPGELGASGFLRGVLDGVRGQLSPEVRGLEGRQQGPLIKLFGEDSAVHYELWLHRGRERVELGLHFETRNAERNRRLLEYVADDLLFLKQVLGQGLEAEPWEKGWTRLYLSYPLKRLDRAEQARLVTAFAEFVETLEPIRREAVQSV